MGIIDLASSSSSSSRLMKHAADVTAQRKPGSYQSLVESSTVTSKIYIFDI
jgi:hypothetical protein